MHYDEILPITNVLKFKKKMWFTEYAYRMDNWIDGKTMGPLRVDAEITRRCNLNCDFCSRKASPINLTEESKKIELSKERWIGLARESGELGVRNWNISGIGEPMCRPDVTLETMKMLKAYNIFGELTTNGTLWKDDWIKKTVEMGWDSVCISIDAPDAETHDNLRGTKGTFDKAANTVKRFRYWRDELNSNLPSITLNVVLNKRNYKKLPEMVELAHKLGADAVFVEPMIIFSKEGVPLKLDKNEMKDLHKYVKKTRDLGEKYNILPTISCVGVELEFDEKLLEKTSNVKKLLLEDGKKNADDKILSIPCYSPWFSMIVRVDGSVLHCGEFEEVLENIKNKSLREIWMGDKFKKIRDDFIEERLPESCNKCRPNIVNDTRQIRQSIKRGRDVKLLQKEILDLLDENVRLRKETYLLRKESKDFANRVKLQEHEKELVKIKNSLTFRLASKIGNSWFGRRVKRVFGSYS